MRIKQIGMKTGLESCFIKFSLVECWVLGVFSWIVVFGFESKILFSEDERGKVGGYGLFGVIKIKISDSLVLSPHVVFEIVGYLKYYIRYGLKQLNINSLWSASIISDGRLLACFLNFIFTLFLPVFVSLLWRKNATGLNSFLSLSLSIKCMGLLTSFLSDLFINLNWSVLSPFSLPNLFKVLYIPK